MILHSWKHAGTVAFPREVAIDFDVLPDVIGVYGRNGAGKTTFLDTILAAFYLQMPFRPKPLHTQFATRGFIEVQWSLAPGGQRYRSRVNVDPVAERTEASLFPAEGGPAIAGPLQKDYLKEIVKKLGSLDLFLCTAYTVQPSYTDKKNTFTFLLADRGERRGIFTELLGLSGYGMKQAACKDAGRAVEAKLATLAALIKQCEGELAKRPAAVTRHRELTQRLEVATATLTAAQEGHQSAVAALQTARETKLGLAPYREQRDVLAAELHRLRVKVEEGVKALDRAEAGVRAAQEMADAPLLREAAANEVAALQPLEAALVPLEAEILALETEIGELRDRVDADRAILDDADAIERAAADLAQLDGLIEAKQTELAKHMNEDSEAASAYQAWLQVRNDLRVKCIERDRILDATAIIETVPCAGMGDFAGCRFLVNAQTAMAQFATVEAAVQDLEAAVGPNREAPKPCAPPIEEHLTQLRHDRREVAKLATLLPQLQAAQSRADDLATWIHNGTQKLDDKRAQHRELADRIAKLPALRDALRMLEPRVVVARSLDAHSATANAKRAEIAGLTDELERKEAQFANIQNALKDYDRVEKAIGDGDIEVVKAAGAMRQAQTTLTALEKEVAEAGHITRVLDAAADRMAGHQRELAPLQDDLDDWTLLTKAFGPAGIAALLVDQALPEISSLATDLLRDCLGETSFTIQLTTQRSSADDKKMLEVLDVVIYRDSKKVAVEDLSGGEGVLVSEALSLAIALYNARRTGTRPYTLFRDEVGANLDEERAPAYTRLLGRALQVGGFRRVLFVSHHQRALALADARIHVVDGVPRPE